MKCEKCGADMMRGYAILPCFTLKICTMCDVAEMDCADWLQSIFTAVFVRFWTGKIVITKEA